MAGIKETVSKGFTKINLKTNNFVTINKINTYITTMEGEIKDLKMEIGEKVYQNLKNNETINEEEIKKLFDTITEKEKEIENQKEEIRKLEEEEKNILGTKTENKAEEVSADVIFCSECGAKNKAGYKFCVKCGKPL